ncbi:MAG: flavodoxin family protein [Defluviitaleaceae bacterium]|nr:flavodoxin family protein [Defluviitaleaceae bacterium]
MKIIALNGSPNLKGGTYLSLKTVCDVLQQEGIEAEILHIGNQVFQGCRGCGGCFSRKNAQCVLKDDGFNSIAPVIYKADGILLGSPVHFSGMGGILKTFLDRLFYVSHANGNLFFQKVGAAVATVRRSGGVATVDSMNHYLQFAGMLMPASNYWNVIHGNGDEEVLKDEEGMQVLTLLGENMAWMLRMREMGQTAKPPANRDKVYMSFIRD